MNSLILFATFIACLAVGVPVVWTMGIATLATLTFGDLSLPAPWLAQQVIRGADSLYLTAIPLFLFSGELMNRGGITSRLVSLAQFLFGRFTGGLGFVNVATAFVYGGISGSATADTSAVSKLMIPSMEAHGYPRAFSAALTAASGTLGIVIPPSVIFILYGVLTNTSIGGLFLAGILPGIGIAIVFMITTWIVARRRGYRGSAPQGSVAEFFRDLVIALPALCMPVFILGAILSGFATATEAAALSVVYALAVGQLIYRELTLRDIWEAIVETVSGTGAVMLIMAMATPFAWVLTVEQIPLHAAETISAIGAGPLGSVGLVVVILLFVGTWLDLGPAMIILAPILTPILISSGVEPFQAGVIFTVALGMGLYTPPVGTNLFVVCNVGKVSLAACSRELLPYWIASAFILVILVLVPSLSEWAPAQFGTR